MSDVYSTYSIP